MNKLSLLVCSYDYLYYINFQKNILVNIVRGGGGKLRPFVRRAADWPPPGPLVDFLICFSEVSNNLKEEPWPIS
jgi:hypothetical protein